VVGFCHDEVVRQWHDTRIRSDGGIRVEWMRAAWAFAQHRRPTPPTLDDIVSLGRIVEPRENADGIRDVNVWIGGRMGAPPSHLRQLLEVLVIGARAVRVGAAPPGLFDGRSVETFGEGAGGVTTVGEWDLLFE